MLSEMYLHPRLKCSLVSAGIHLSAGIYGVGGMGGAISTYKRVIIQYKIISDSIIDYNII